MILQVFSNLNHFMNLWLPLQPHRTNSSRTLPNHCLLIAKRWQGTPSPSQHLKFHSKEDKEHSPSTGVWRKLQTRPRSCKPSVVLYKCLLALIQRWLLVSPAGFMNNTHHFHKFLIPDTETLDFFPEVACEILPNIVISYQTDRKKSFQADHLCKTFTCLLSFSCCCLA